MSLHEQNVKQYHNRQERSGKIGQGIFISVLVIFGLYCLIGLIVESKKNLPVDRDYVSGKESK